MDTNLPNGTQAGTKPVQLSVSLPHAPDTRIRLHLTVRNASLLLFCTTTSAEGVGGAASLGSFVFAIPNTRDSSAQPLCTPLYTQTATLDFTTRLATILARKSGRPTYVGNSMSFAGQGLGGTVEEVMDAMGRVVEVVVAELERRR